MEEAAQIGVGDPRRERCAHHVEIEGIVGRVERDIGLREQRRERSGIAHVGGDGGRLLAPRLQPGDGSLRRGQAHIGDRHMLDALIFGQRAHGDAPHRATTA